RASQALLRRSSRDVRFRMIDEQLAILNAERAREGAPPATKDRLPNGAYLITVPEVDFGPGWTRRKGTVLFVAPPGYPAAQPDCFWVEPDGLRVEGGGTPQNCNDGNPIPGDTEVGRRTTWFSWHWQ